MSEEYSHNELVIERELSDTSALDIVQETLDTFLATADVDTVYGEPYEKDGNVIIPAAEIVAGFGLGVGSGLQETDGIDKTGKSSGGGTGGHIFSRPVAVIISSSEGVRIEPIIDITKIAIASLTAGAFMLATYLRIRKFIK